MIPLSIFICFIIFSLKKFHLNLEKVVQMHVQYKKKTPNKLNINSLGVC
jgi:hypothetical protein